ncbi:MAG: hypothetical protein FJ265_05245 [Planctomycetes bacterium]|nr:hypothetical protein [Planctomycetota bacterium]
MKPGAGPVRLPWRWLFDSPLVLAAWAAAALCCFAAVRFVAAVRAAERARQRAGTVLAQVAAEAAALEVAGVSARRLPFAMSMGGVQVRVEAAGSGLLLTANPRGSEARQFRSARLPGAASAAFGEPLTVARPEPDFAAQLPAIDAAAVATAWAAEALPWFRRDVGVALLHFDAGTEADDFVFDPGLSQLGLPATVDLVVVPGNLWVEPGRAPLRLPLERDLTVVVRGNLYVGRSLAIDGPGRLVFASTTCAGGAGFVDRDGNGRWSAGEPTCEGLPFRGRHEGAGNVHLGLPGHGPALEVAAGLVVAGQLHLRCSARVAGPVVLAHAPHDLAGPPARLRATGDRLFVPDREVVPGFLSEGAPRAGLLLPVPGPSVVAERPLYPAAPAR